MDDKQETFRKHLIINRYAPRTIEAYTKYEKLFLTEEGKEIGQDNVNNFLVNHKNGSLVRGFLKAYIEYLDFPIKIAKIKGRKKKKEAKYIDINKAYELAEKLYPADLKYCMIVLFLIEGGFRISELLNLKYSNVDFDTNKIKILESKTGFREVIISEETKKVLQHYMETPHYTPEGYIFDFKTRDESLSDLEKLELKRQRVCKQIKKYGEMYLGMELHPHMFRHGCGFYLTNTLDMPLDEVAIYLGHSKLDTTQIYAHKDKKRVLDKIKQSYDK